MRESIGKIPSRFQNLQSIALGRRRMLLFIIGAKTRRRRRRRRRERQESEVTEGRIKGGDPV